MKNILAQYKNLFDDPTLSRSAWRSFASLPETTLKSPFLCVNKSPFRYGFRAGARAFRYSVVIALDECFGNDREREILLPPPLFVCRGGLERTTEVYS